MSKVLLEEGRNGTCLVKLKPDGVKDQVRQKQRNETFESSPSTGTVLRGVLSTLGHRGQSPNANALMDIPQIHVLEAEFE